MKKIAVASVAILLAIGLSACATVGKGKGKGKEKGTEKGDVKSSQLKRKLSNQEVGDDDEEDEVTVDEREGRNVIELR